MLHCAAWKFRSFCWTTESADFSSLALRSEWLVPENFVNPVPLERQFHPYPVDCSHSREAAFRPFFFFFLQMFTSGMVMSKSWLRLSPVLSPRLCLDIKHGGISDVLVQLAKPTFRSRYAHTPFMDTVSSTDVYAWVTTFGGNLIHHERQTSTFFESFQVNWSYHFPNEKWHTRELLESHFGTGIACVFMNMTDQENSKTKTRPPSKSSHNTAVQHTCNISRRGEKSHGTSAYLPVLCHGMPIPWYLKRSVLGNFCSFMAWGLCCQTGILYTIITLFSD